MRSPREILAANLSRLLKEKGMEKQALAAKAGMPPSSVSRYLAKKRSATIDAVARLARALGTTPAALLDDGREREVDHPIDECLRRVADATMAYEGIKQAIEEATRGEDAAALDRLRAAGAPSKKGG